LRFTIRAAIASLAALAILGGGSSAMAAVAPAPSATHITVPASANSGIRPVAVPTTLAPGTAFAPVDGRRPRYVAGYTDHALQRMRERNISADQVQTVVGLRAEGQWQPDNRTWKISDGRVTVIENENAYVVTVW
jgi:hypothetical protein